MKHLSSILLSAVLTCLMFSAVLYSSCSKTDKCDTIVCQNGGTCKDGACLCLNGYEGARCETKTDLCKNVNCLNGGKCFAGNCNCPTNFTGKYCEIDLCASINCNNGHCNIGKCACDTGYEGKFCDTMVRDKFLGTWHGTANCSGNDPVTVVVTPGSNPADITLQYSSPSLSFSVSMSVTPQGTMTMKQPVQIDPSQKVAGSMGMNSSGATFSYTLSYETGGGKQCYTTLTR